MSPGSVQEIKVVVNGNTYVVEVGDLSGFPTTVTVNGQDYQVDLEEVETQDAPAAAAPTPAPAAASPTPAPAVRRASAAKVGAGGQVTAPMPGNIVGVSVKQGDRVDVGQELCWLEAMKMKNAIRATQAGVIGSVEVSEGQTVAYGDVLLSFE